MKGCTGINLPLPSSRKHRSNTDGIVITDEDRDLSEVINRRLRSSDCAVARLRTQTTGGNIVGNGYLRDNEVNLQWGDPKANAIA